MRLMESGRLDTLFTPYPPVDLYSATCLVGAGSGTELEAPYFCMAYPLPSEPCLGFLHGLSRASERESEAVWLTARSPLRRASPLGG